MKLLAAAILNLSFSMAYLVGLPAIAGDQNTGANDTVIFDAFDTPYGWTTATDVDKSGTSVGYYSYTGPSVGFIRTPSGDFTRLEFMFSGLSTLGTYPRAISEQRTVAGWSALGCPDIAGCIFFKSWLYSLDTGSRQEIEYPGAFSTVASDMNEHGLAVGWAAFSENEPSDRSIGFSWQRGVFKAIAIPGARNTKIVSVNEKGQMAGSFWDENQYDATQFIMEPDGSYAIVSPKFTINTLGNNGDYAGECRRAAGYLVTCYYSKEADRTIKNPTFWGQECGSKIFEVVSIKAQRVTGSCNFEGYSRGFIAPRHRAGTLPR